MMDRTEDDATRPDDLIPSTPPGLDVEADRPALVVIVMGVAGSGKSTVGALLAGELSLPFVEADDYHDPGSIAQMGRGRPLTSTQRHDWLERVHDELVHRAEGGAVCACSALTRSARDQLVDGIDEVAVVWLHGPDALLRGRLAERVGHPIGTSLLPSQLDALEPPTDAFEAQIGDSPAVIVDDAIDWLRHRLAP